MAQGDLVVGANGKLSTELQSQLKSIKSKFNRTNDKLAKTVEEQSDIAKRLKSIRDKKKELTAKYTAEEKELKIRNKQINEEKLMLLGERTARVQDLNELLVLANGKDKKVLETVREKFELVEK